MNKHLLRKKFISLTTQAIDHYPAIDNAVRLIEKFDPKVVGIYIAYEHEIDLSSLMLTFPNKRFAVPKINAEKDEIFFVNYMCGSVLEPNARYKQYIEPASNTEAVPDMVFIPALAFDLKGNRLGRGRGHYDRYLSNHNPVKIGVSTSERLLLRLPADIHDVKMDYLITENMILQTQ